MDEKYRQGLANQVRELHGQVLNVREDFIGSEACTEFIDYLENMAETCMVMYLNLTRPVKK